ncbi:MAG: hypothetical protein ACOC6D_02530 [Atribacterota bacterium]
MKKKILIGSIIVVAVLIGVSFTTVVGYRSIQSDVKASPLFNIRTNRAIDEESKDLTCDYVGKGKECTISIPKRDKQMALLQKIMDAIGKMDDETINRYKNLVVKQIYDNKDNIGKDLTQEELQQLYRLKYALNYTPNILGTTHSVVDACCPTLDGGPYCDSWLYLLLFLLLISIPFIMLILLDILCSITKLLTCTG